MQIIKRTPNIKHQFSTDKYSLTALLAISTISLIQFLQLASLDLSLSIALYAFSLSIPMLSALIITLVNEEGYIFTIRSKYLDAVAAIGTISTFLGLVCVFWHFAWQAAIVFIIAAVAGFIVTAIFNHHLLNANKNLPA